MVHHTCTNCHAKKSKKFWFYEDGSILCSTCNKKLGHIVQEHIDKKKIHQYKTYFWGAFAVAMFLVLLTAILAPLSIITVNKMHVLEDAYIQASTDVIVAEESLSRYRIITKDIEHDLEIALIPPYTTINKENITFTFLVHNNRHDWDFSRDIITYKTNQENKPTLSFELQNKVFTVIDLREYITTTPFNEKIQPIIANKEEKEIISILQHMTLQFMSYEYEIIDTPKQPLETLVDGVGDCDDSAILFASLVKAARPDWQVSFAYVDSTNPLYPNEINHVMVLITTESTDYLIETTSSTNIFIEQEFDAHLSRI